MTVAPDTAMRQALAHGPLGTAILDIERARRGMTSWETVHHQLAATGPVMDGDEGSLFLGAPAVTYVLHLAAANTGRYARALHTLDHLTASLTRRRLAAAHARIDQNCPTHFAEYDLFRGLTGLGALLLHRQPDGDEMRQVLHYLVRLTEPLPSPDGTLRPGWWVDHAPTIHDTTMTGGHANAGLAHGITGPLALLALAHRHGVTVPGQQTAMTRIVHWLDEIRIHDHGRTRWPRWITHSGPDTAAPAAPSWCYGTAGLARAQQLAALALGDAARKTASEHALLDCLTDPHQLDQLTGRGLCHGLGALIRTVQRVAHEADDPTAFTSHLPQLKNRFLASAPPKETGFLEGAAGAALAFQDNESTARPLGDWDTCLLLS